MKDPIGPTVSELVRKDYRAADVLKKWGINYCCGGNLPLAQVCAVRQLDLHTVEADLERALRPRGLSPAIDFTGWSLPFLIDYIENVHHAYIRDAGPGLQQQLSSFVSGHLKKYPYLKEVEEAFSDLLGHALQQLEEEEVRVFPYLRQLVHAHNSKGSYGGLFVRTLGGKVNSLQGGQHHLAAALEELRRLTDRYQFTPDACTNYQVLYHKLREFDDDLTEHRKLEDQVLFPRMLQIEKELRGQ